MHCIAFLILVYIRKRRRRRRRKTGLVNRW